MLDHMTDTTAFPAPQPPSYGPPSAAMAAPTSAPAVPAPAAAAPRPPRTRLRDVVFGWRAALAVLLAGVIVGGLVGASITFFVDHHGSGSTAPQFNGFGQRFGGRAGTGGGAGGTLQQFGGQGFGGQAGSGNGQSGQSGSDQSGVDQSSGQAQGSEFFG